jgi:PAS domain S-box-containing protein
MVKARDVSRRDLGPWRATFRYDHPERGEIWIAGDSQPVRRDDGATVWHGYLQDVTARETAARALAESEARVRALKDERLAALEDKAKLAEQLSLLAEALPGAVCSYVLAADGTRSFTYASSNVRKLLGFGPALHELDLSLISAQVRADDLPQLLARRDASRRDLGTWRGTFRYNHPERGEIWISGDSQPVRRDDGATVWHGYLQDVTARETAARALAESEARVRALKDERLAALEDKARLAEQLTLLANTLPGAIYTFVRRPDGSAYLSYAAPQIETLLGAGPDIYGGDFMTLASRVHIADMQGFNDPDATETARAQKVWRAVFRYAHPDKGEIWLEGHARAAPREDGGLVWHGYLQDVTARETVARALTESEARRLTALEDKARLAERLSLLAEALPGAIGAYVRPAQGDSHFSYVSPNVERLTGFSPSVCQHDLPRVIARIHPEDFRNIMIAEAASARDCSRWNEVFRYNHPERGEIWIQGDGQPVRRDDGATMWHGYFQDVTEREAAARDLAESEARVRALKDERLALLEKMAVRLAHEVNQPLAAGATLLAVARRKIDPPHPGGAQYADLNGACEAVDKAARQLLRAGRIVTRMREFSRHGEPDKTFRSLHETIRETIDSLKSFSSLAAFEIVTRLDAARDRVLIDRVQITQVLVNLIQNARQAALYEGPRTIVVASRNHDREIHISVIDYGSGLSEDARRHLFELFWTTKSSGMGVGLATARAIVEAHYGTIWARESSAEGTVFTFSLPLVEGSDFPGELE